MLYGVKKMFYLLKRVCLFVSVVANLGASAKVSGNVSFKTVAKIVCENNPTIKSEKYKKLSTDESLAQSFSEYYPNIMLRLYSGFERLNKNRRDHSSEQLKKSHYSRGAITLNHNLYNGLGTKHKLKYSYYSVDSARYSYYSKEQEILFEALKAFVDVWGAKKYLENAKKMEKNLKEVLAARKLQLESGEIKIQDYASVESAFYSAQARVIGSDAEYKSALASLHALTVEKIDGDFRLPKTFDKLLPSTLKDFINISLKKNAQMMARRSSIDSAKEYLSIEYSSFAPKIDLEGQVAKRWDHKVREGRTFRNMYFENINRDIYQDTTYIGLSMKIPLWQNSGRSISSNVRKAEEELSRVEFEYLASVANLKSECKRVWNQYYASIEQEKKASEAVRSSKVAIDGYKKSEILGVESSTNVIYNENKLLDAKNKYIAAKIEKLKSLLESEFLMGALNPDYFGIQSKDQWMINNEKFVKHAPVKF